MRFVDNHHYFDWCSLFLKMYQQSSAVESEDTGRQ
jgi:hypothetical protein